VDAPPKNNRTLREQYAKSWGTPQVRRGHLEKIKFAVNYEKGESRLVKHEVRRRGGNIVRVSEAHVLVIDRIAVSVATDQAILKYRPDWQIWSEHFFEAFPPLEVLSFEVQREASSVTAGSIDRVSSEAGMSGVAENADGAVATRGNLVLTNPFIKLLQQLRIHHAQVNVSHEHRQSTKILLHREMLSPLYMIASGNDPSREDTTISTAILKRHRRSKKIWIMENVPSGLLRPLSRRLWKKSHQMVMLPHATSMRSTVQSYIPPRG
jgi:hypothetical protein